MVLVDNDVVSASNVNRQVLFSVRDVGRRKVDAAKESLEDAHNIHTGIHATMAGRHFFFWGSGCLGGGRGDEFGGRVDF